MNCYECALAGQMVAAVAVCPHCGAGLCLKHRRLAEKFWVGGARYGCPHQTLDVERQHQTTLVRQRVAA